MVEGLEEEAFDSLSAGTVGVPVTYGSSIPTGWKKKWQHAYRRVEQP
jgi:hypothetical protein